MKRLGVLFLICILLPPVMADEIKLGDFPQGKWLDSTWQAYWSFGENTIRLLDVRDQAIYDFTGIVQNMKVKKIPDGIRLTFDCALAKRSYQFEKINGYGELNMIINQAGKSLAYSTYMPAISDGALAIYKETVIAAETAITAKTAIENAKPSSTPAEELTLEQAVSLAVDALLKAAVLSDFKKLDALSGECEESGLGDQILNALEAEAAKPDSAPSVFIALSALYGRKGLKVQEYAALNAAEESAAQPGVSFNLALVYGRKKLLAAAEDADGFMVGTLELRTTPPGAKIFVDGTELGMTPLTIEKVKAGSRSVSLVLAGYIPHEERIELDVGKTAAVSRSLEPTGKYGNLTIKSPNKKTAISINGNQVDKGTWTGSLPEGTCIILGQNSDRSYERLEYLIEADGNQTVTLSPKMPAIGDRGPAGGIVFYAKKRASLGWQFLEAAPADLDDLMAWGDNTDLSKTGTAIGTGEQNTAAITNKLGARDFASQACAAFALGGFDDWFLPSKDELQEMFLQKMAIGGFTVGNYWSSSESGYGSAWGQGFGLGGQGNGFKGGPYYIRPIRAF